MKITAIFTQTLKNMKFLYNGPRLTLQLSAHGHCRRYFYMQSIPLAERDCTTAQITLLSTNESGSVIGRIGSIQFQAYTTYGWCSLDRAEPWGITVNIWMSVIIKTGYSEGVKEQIGHRPNAHEALLKLDEILSKGQPPTSTRHTGIENNETLL